MFVVMCIAADIQTKCQITWGTVLKGTNYTLFFIMTLWGKTSVKPNASWCKTAENVMFHLTLGCLLDIAHGTPISITLVTPARRLLFTPNTGLQPEARPPLISPPPDSWHLLWDCYWVNDELRMHASFSCSFLRSIIRDYSRSSAAAPRRIKVCEWNLLTK